MKGGWYSLVRSMVDDHPSSSLPGPRGISQKSKRGAFFVAMVVIALACFAVFFFTGKAAVVDQGPAVLRVGTAETCFNSATEKGLGISRKRFPDNFVFGTATSAFQVEGAATTDGKGQSIWDVFTHTPGKISDGTDADMADSSYYKIEEDVAAMKAMGVQSYRFSIAWSRVLPEGTGAPNEAGIAYYSKLIDTLIRAGITPAATLYHWDLPQALEEKYGGWLNRNVVEDFAQYAALCFARFGDRVKTWITLNEPQQTTTQGYGGGTFAPGRCSDRSHCAAGNSSTEPYIAGHHQVLAHAAAVREYRTGFQKAQGGRIGITLDCVFYFPLDPQNPKDRAAAQRAMEFQLPWFLDPVMNGTYPGSMSLALGSRLPEVSAADAALLRDTGSDFLGLNFYTAAYASEGQAPGPGWENPWSDRQINSHDKDTEGNPIGESSGSPWLKVVPKSIFHMLTWINKRYPGLPILVTENGISQNASLSQEELLCDTQRIEYHRDHLKYILLAIKKGVPVEAYYAWSLMDNFEWASGYTQRFGIHYVDFSDPVRQRVPKASALWWESFLKHSDDSGGSDDLPADAE